MTTANKRRRIQPIPQQQQQHHGDAASQPHATAASASSPAPPLLSLKSALHFPFPPPAPPSPPSALSQSQDAPPRLTPLSPVLSSPPSALSSVASPPPPRPAPPAAINFDAAFTLLDDDIVQSPEPVAAAAFTSAAGKRKKDRRKGGSSAAPQRPTAAADVSVVLSSLPGSPSSPSTSAPTAVTTPSNSTVTAAPLLPAAGESNSRLMRQLELLSGAQQATTDDSGAESAASTKSSSRGRRGKPASSASRAAGKGKKTAKASAASAKLRRSNSGSSPRRRGSSFIDTTNAQDIRAFMPPPPPPPPPAPSHQPQTRPEEASASVRPAAVPASARPGSSGWTAVSSLSSSLWSSSAEVNIAALRERFNLGKAAGASSVTATTETQTAAEPKAEGEETEGRPAATRKERRGAKAEKPPRQSAATRSRTRRAQQQEQQTAAATQPDVVDSDAVMADAVADAGARTTLSISPTSLLLSAPSAAESQAVSEAASTEAGEEQVQPLERAKTVIAVNNTAELESRETLPLASASFVLSSPPASSSPEPPTPQQQTEAERAAQRQMSLASNTSSSSTASIVSSRLQSPELLSSLLPPFPCESLPCTFRDYAVKHLHCSLSASLSLSCSAVTTAGNVRVVNQDAFALSSMPAAAEGGAERQVAVLGVFDGHGSLGDNAARLCAEFMPDRLTSLLSSRQSSAASCLRQTFDAAQHLLLRIARAEQSVMASTLRKCSPQLDVVANASCVSIHARAAISPPHSPSPPLPPADHDALHADLAPPGLLRGVGFGHGELSEDAKEDRSPEDADVTEVTEEEEEKAPVSAAEAQQSDASAGGAAQLKKKRRRKARLFKPRKRATPSPPAASSQIALAPPAAVQPAQPGSALPSIAESGPPSPLNGSSGALQPIKRSPIKNLPGREGGGGGRGDGWQTKQRAALPSAGLSAFSAVVPSSFPPSPSSRPAAHRPAVVAVDLDYGTTGLLVMVDGNELVIANCGDSRCIVFDQQRPLRDEQSSTPTAHTVRAVSPLPPSSRPRQLSRASRSFSSPFSSYSSPSSLRWQQRFVTVDHDPSLPTVASQAEARRVLANHGALQQLPGQQRVYPACLSFSEARSRALTLNMSRALGHNLLSQHGVSHQPDVDTVSLQPQPAASGSERAQQAGRDVWLVLGSDGLWDVMTVDDVLQLLDGQLEEQSRRRRLCRGGGGGQSLCLECLCCQLLSKAEEGWRQRGHGDNISVVLAHIN